MKSFYSIPYPIIHGVFRHETRNRFLASVEINEADVECYIPSSARLENFIELENRRVLLVPTQTINARTKYAILAFKHDRHNIILNTSLTNKAFHHYIHYHKKLLYGTESTVFAEKGINGYKADLFIESPVVNRIIEIKSVLSINELGIFPTVFSERSNRQLQQLESLMPRFSVEYNFIAINPRMKRICINNEQKEYYTFFMRCVKKGMAFKGYSCALIGKKVKIIDELPVIL